MRVRISDKQALLSISPTQLMAYLRSKGARQVDEFSGKAAVWSYGDEELLVPLATRFADYAARMADILAALEREEDRSQLQILHDLQYSDFDIIRIKVFSEYSKSNILTIMQHIKFIIYIRAILFAVAYAVSIGDLPYRRRKKTAEFMDTIFLSQANYDNPVFNIISPVATKGDYDSIFINRVIPGLQNMLEDIQNKRLSKLNYISFQACRIIRKLYTCLRPCQLCISITYSSRGDTVLEPFHINIDRQFVDRLNDILDERSKKQIHINDIPLYASLGFSILPTDRFRDEILHIQGYVVGLQYDESTGTREVKIRAVSPAFRLILVELPQEDYRRAIMAHASRKLVELTGTVTRSGRTLRLVADSPLTIVEDNA